MEYDDPDHHLREQRSFSGHGAGEPDCQRRNRERDGHFEYGTFAVVDRSLPKAVPFTPTCFDLTKSAGSQYFSFAEINVPSPSQGSPEFSWALVKKPLVVSAAAGYGLDYWRQILGVSRIINSGFRDPAQNKRAGGVESSRHQFGDAVDLRNQSGSVQEWQLMFDTAGSRILNTGARADFREPQSGPCKLGCMHADWRYHDRGQYAH